MEERTKNIWSVVVLVLVAAAAYVFYFSPGAGQISQNEEQGVSQETNLLEVQGNVISVSSEELEITMDATTAPTEDSLKGPSRTVKLNPATVIEGVTLRKNENGQMEALFLGETNFGELKRGRLVIVSYKSAKGNVIDGVEKVTVLVKEDVEGI